MNAFLKWGLALSVMVLAGCQSVLDEQPKHRQTTLEISHTDPQWQQHLNRLKQITAYTAKGQFGYISPEERFSAHFDWQYHTPSRFSLTLSSNLSAKSLKLQRTAQGLTISDSAGNARSEADVAALMEEIIGVSFPIDRFAYWLKGQPEESDTYLVNSQHLLAEFNYPMKDGVWKATFAEYHSQYSPMLPKLIGLENGKQTLKIRIDNWTY